MENFDIAKYLKEHRLGSYGMFNGYVDIKPLKEEETEVELNTEIPYEGPEHKLTGNGEGDEFKQAETISEEEMEEIHGGFNIDPSNPEDVSYKFIGQGPEASHNTEVLAKAIEALAKAGLTKDQMKAFASTIENDPETLELALQAFE